MFWSKPCKSQSEMSHVFNPYPWGGAGERDSPHAPTVWGLILWYFRLCKSNWISAWNLAFPVFTSLIAWNMCENLYYESVYFNWPRILLTDNIQNGGSCGVNYTLGGRGFSCAVSGFGQVIRAIDRLETRSRSIQHGKSTRSAPEISFSRLRHSYLRPSAEDGSACGRRISSSHATKKVLVPRVCQL